MDMDKIFDHREREMLFRIGQPSANARPDGRRNGMYPLRQAAFSRNACEGFGRRVSTNAAIGNASKDVLYSSRSRFRINQL